MELFELHIDKVSIESTELVQNWVNDKDDRELVELKLFPSTYVLNALRDDVELFLKDHPEFYLIPNVPVTFHLDY
jgi:hypothetical protein